MSTIAVIDYGMGNLHSVAKALEHVQPGVEVWVTSDAQKIADADRVLLPGVGAIRDCMSEIYAQGVDKEVAQAIRSGRPFLGICVGYQALMQRSEENGGVDCLGEFEGQWLSDLSDEDLLSIYETIKSDSESVALLEAYLDRRLSDWREHADAHHSDGEGFSPGSGSMTKEEAYQVLGLEPGATKAEIRKAWRNLMKSMHPDSGGSEFLAAKINAAKDILLN